MKSPKKKAAPKKPAKRKPAAKAAAPPKKPPRRPRVATGGDAEYERYRENQAGISRARSQKGREVGEIPPIANVSRRARCRESLRDFCETYNREAFCFGWSAAHLKAIARIEEAVFQGALYAFAMARGSGKTTICRMAALWALSYAHCRYVFVIGATADKAKETLDTLRILIRYLPDYVADFPEISHPAVCLAGIANRATGQTCQGESTLIEWASDRIVLATVPPPANWPKAWKLRDDGMVPTSGNIVSAAGLTGEGIRGSLKTLATGEMVRPDLVLLDDPQTPESARSLTQNTNRLHLVSADVLGMAGPGEAIAAVMPCTVIEQGDMVDEVLNREKHPLWRGERSGILDSMPTNLTDWDKYFEVYERCAQLEPPDFSAANAYYLRDRDKLDAGAVASWPERKLDWEISAIQHAMHLYCRDPRAFMAEYMNRPQVENAAAAAALDPADVAAKAAPTLPRRTVPRDGTRLTAMIDVGAELLWYVITAWDEKFGGCVIDYGAYPDQSRSYFAKTDPRPGLTELPAVKGQSQDAAIYAGLNAVAARILGFVYRQEETRQEMRVERCLVDANWGPATDLVYEWCRRSPYAQVLIPSHGKFIGASSTPIEQWQLRPGERRGSGWRLSTATTARGRHVVFDTNAWKTFVADRIRTPQGAAGCLRLFAAGTDKHRLFSDHCAAEYPVEVTGKGRRVNEWKLKPGRDNDLFDGLVGTAVAASLQGLVWSAGRAAGEPEPKSTARQPLDLKAEWEKQQAEKKRRRAG